MKKDVDYKKISHDVALSYLDEADEHRMSAMNARYTEEATTHLLAGILSALLGICYKLEERRLCAPQDQEED